MMSQADPPDFRIDAFPVIAQPAVSFYNRQSCSANKQATPPRQEKCHSPQRRKRMKFGKVGQVGLVSAIALGVATLFTACSSTLTVGFLFVATNKQTPGQIEVYEVDSESGSLRTIPTSPFPSGGRNPIAEVAAPNFKNLYVVNNDDNNIVQFGIGTDGKLYSQTTVNTPGSFPMAVTMNAAGTFLYVVDTLQPIAGCTLTNPCPGDVAAYPVNADGSLGSPVTNTTQYPTYWPLLLSPTDTKTVLTPNAVNILANGNTLYVSAANAATGAGYLFAYSINSTGGLTPLNNGVPLSVGTNPVALISDSTSSFLYVADKSTGKISSFAVQPDGTLNLQSTALAGSLPSSLTLFGDKFLYVANSGDSNVTGYSISSGTLTRVGVSASDTNPIAITVDPKQVGFLYTVNFLGNTLSGFQIDPTAGTLINTQRTPYPSSVQPTAVAGIPHGSTAK
jgi:6-phosphogluconolactonase